MGTHASPQGREESTPHAAPHATRTHVPKPLTSAKGPSDAGTHAGRARAAAVLAHARQTRAGAAREADQARAPPSITTETPETPSALHPLPIHTGSTREERARAPLAAAQCTPHAPNAPAVRLAAHGTTHILRRVENGREGERSRGRATPSSAGTEDARRARGRRGGGRCAERGTRRARREEQVRRRRGGREREGRDGRSGTRPDRGGARREEGGSARGGRRRGRGRRKG